VKHYLEMNCETGKHTPCNDEKTQKSITFRRSVKHYLEMNCETGKHTPCNDEKTQNQPK